MSDLYAITHHSREGEIAHVWRIPTGPICDSRLRNVLGLVSEIPPTARLCRSCERTLHVEANPPDSVIVRQIKILKG